MNTYITSKAMKYAGVKPQNGIVFKAAPDGARHTLKQDSLIDATLHGKPIRFHAFAIIRIGKDEKGNEIDVLFGALAMRQWGIDVKPQQERLDLKYYPKELAEY